jgi:Flp pilus assembly protein TadD
VALIIRTCNKARLRHAFVSAAMLIAVGITFPVSAASGGDANMDRYVAARLAEFDDRGAEALKSYLQLFNAEPQSSAIADRLYQSAMLQGDMASAVRAVRVLELRNETDATAPLLLFADYFKKRDWRNAEIAIAELEVKSNFGFVGPILRSWLNVAQGKPHGFQTVDARINPILHYYSSDQVAYLELASGNLAAAKPMLSAFRNVENDFARDLMLNAAPYYAANNEIEFAKSLIAGRLDDTSSSYSANGSDKPKSRFNPLGGTATIYTRLSAALMEQNVPEQALIMARIANWLDPKSESAKLALAKSLLSSGQGKAAYSLIDSIKPTSPYSSQATQEKIRSLLKNGNKQLALELAQSQRKNNPELNSALLLVAQMHEENSDFSRATDAYNELVVASVRANDNPRKQALYRFFLATAFDKKGNWNQARIQLQEARALDPNNPYILNYLGFTLLERREEISGALEMVKRAYQLSPDSPAIADSLGWGYFLIGNTEQAVNMLEKAVKQSGHDTVMNEHLGDAYWKAGRRVDARYAWKTAAYQAEKDALSRLQRKMEQGLNGTIAGGEPKP